MAADALKHRDVCPEVKDKILELFKQGYSPSKALQLHKYDLQVEFGDEYVVKSADRTVCPDLQYCYRLYYKAFKEEYGEPKGEEVLKKLEMKLAKYNQETNIKSSDVEVVEGKQVVIAIVTPLMRCVHANIKHAAELVFMDASGNMDRQGCRVFLILTHSCNGGLPPGVLVTTSESTETITVGLTLYNSLLDETYYFGGGSLGPEIFMTDDSASERQALRNVYPSADILLRIFHVLQSFWRFLWASKTGVRKEDRPKLLFLLEERYNETLADPTLGRYANVRKHIEGVYWRKTAWALCYRTKTRSNDTDNFAEAAMRIMKDQIVDRTKAYNVQQLVDFIVTKLEAYYERRLLDICNNRLDRALQSWFLPAPLAGRAIDASEIKKIGETLYSVPSEENADVAYVVDVSVGSCTCKIGKTGGPCKHQYLVVRKYSLTTWNFIPVHDPVMRKLLFTVATGSLTVPTEHWFSSLRSGPCATPLSTTDVRMEENKSDNADHVERMEEDEAHSDNETFVNKTKSDHYVHEVNSGRKSQDPLESLHLQQSPQNRFDMRSVVQRTGTADNSEIWLNELKDVFTSFEHRYSENKEYFTQPLKSFIGQAKGLKTDSALVSALTCFGKYPGAATSLGQRRKTAPVSCKQIGVQPIAIAKRQMMGGSKNHVRCGRPCMEQKKLGAKEKRLPLSSQVVPRRKAPHSLCKCVVNNEALGKTHSAK